MQQKKENDNIMNYDTVRLDDENNATKYSFCFTNSS